VSLAERLAGAVTEHSKLAIAVMVVLTVLVGAGAPMVESSSSLDQFQTESEESEKLDYIQANFSTGDENTTTAQIIVRGDNVLSRDSLIGTLRFEQALYANSTVNSTLVENDSISGIANAVARTAIAQEEAAALQRRAANVEIGHFVSLAFELPEEFWHELATAAGGHQQSVVVGPFTCVFEHHERFPPAVDDWFDLAPRDRPAVLPVGEFRQCSLEF